MKVSKVFQVSGFVCMCVMLPDHCMQKVRYVLGLLTALGGQLAVEFGKLWFHRNADGASQKVDLAGRRAPLLQKKGTDLLRERERERRRQKQSEKFKDR